MNVASLSSVKARVLVVEDEESVRTVVEIALRAAGHEVRLEADGSNLNETIAQFRPDLAILDVRLPVGPDGYTMARTLRERADVPVLLLTAADSLSDRLDGFRAGADDHMGKPFSADELLARVNALLRRSGRLTPSLLSFEDVVVDEGTRLVTRAGARIALTRTEYELLVVLIRHPEQVLSKEQLLAQLRGFDAFDPNVIQVHVSALRRKLEAHGPRIIQTIWGVGYALRT